MDKLDFTEAKYLQPEVYIPNTGYRTADLDPARKLGYEIHEFEEEVGGVILSLLGSIPLKNEEDMANQVATLKKCLPGLLNIHIVGKRSTIDV